MKDEIKFALKTSRCAAICYSFDIMGKFELYVKLSIALKLVFMSENQQNENGWIIETKTINGNNGPILCSIKVMTKNHFKT